MKQNQLVEEAIRCFQPNELIVASKLFSEKLEGRVSEAAYLLRLQKELIIFRR